MMAVSEEVQHEDGSVGYEKIAQPVKFEKRLETGHRLMPRVALIENFASNAVVQKLVDVKPDRTSPEIL